MHEFVLVWNLSKKKYHGRSYSVSKSYQVCSPPWMFLPLDILLGYWTKHVSTVLLYVKFTTLCQIYYFMSNLLLYVKFTTLCQIHYFMSNLLLYVKIYQIVSKFIKFTTLCQILSKFFKFTTLCQIYYFMSNLLLYVKNYAMVSLMPVTKYVFGLVWPYSSSHIKPTTYIHFYD